jgi:2-methylcitrate dehydratase PrpD
MHVDGSWHSLGAAAAAARLAGLDAAGAARAVRLASCQVPFSLYAPIAAGMDGRNLYPAHAVLLGVAAAASAAAGMDAPAEGLALGRTIALGATEPGARAPTGEWLLAEGYVKPFAGVRHAHYGACAALALRPALAGRYDALRGIVLETYGEAITYAGNRAPGSAIKAQFSLSWAVAAALAQGDLGPAAYTDAALADPLLRGLEAMVELREDKAMTAAGRRAARITLDLGGEAMSEAVDGVAGDPGRPMTEAEVRAKFARMAGPVLGDAIAQTVAERIVAGDAAAGVAPFG